MLTRERILGLFAELNGELCQAGIRGDIFIVGGAAMIVAYNARPATRDVDGIWHPSTEVRAAAARVATRHEDLEPDWLNDGVKGFLPGDDPGHSTVVYDNDCLTVSAPSPEYLLATKLLASRVSRDEEDILRLYDLCGFSSVNEGLDLLERYYPGRPIEAKVGFFLEELLAEGGSVPVGGGLPVLERLVAQGRATAPTVRPDEPLPMPPVLGDPALDTAQELAVAREDERW